MTKRELERENTEDRTTSNGRILDSNLEQHGPKADAIEQLTYRIPPASNPKQHSARKYKVPVIDKTSKRALSRKSLVMKSLLHGNQPSGGKRSCAGKPLGRVP